MVMLLPPRTEGRLPSRERTDHPRRSTLVALLLACAVLVVLDATSPALGPARRLLGEVYGPLQSGASALARPITSVPDWLASQRELRGEVARLTNENDRLTQELAAAPFDRNRLAEYDGLMSAAENLGYAIVPAQVIGHGPSQSFSRTVTIDAGSEAGIAADMTVLAAQGLVGRVLRVTSATATVLLISDADSVVGGRVGTSMEVGFVHGGGVLGRDGRLDLELLDQHEVPTIGDTVVTWGSSKGAPYVSGVPIGKVESVYRSLRDSTQRARITPFVTFSALDLVGVAVPSGTRSDRAVIDVDGSLK
jgi:rod shape-determining protein MreC